MNDRINLTILPMGLAAFSAALDNNVLNVCLPIIAGEFNTDIGKVQFVSSSYVFTICSLLLFFAYVSSAAGTTVAGLFYALLMKIGYGTVMAAFYGLVLFIILSMVVLISDTLSYIGQRYIKRQTNV
ncbi:hypothetical protein [Pelotomaculum propionicicum]|uniref:Major facilitator superfamily (MFS) profile domain-containing protein n=1 Tax=Pelotomaculum propionicicum TaxID=258475 RepID=A0A4Y7RPQ9_9FIRM|nr:hypothetical protein [Pelotomaculum propionicicum]NLI11281.1 MFS transporter [Peptococcaceae bacterium]TEB10985.1 hypothetical protein Pmgp_02001 [Pelotomaculum propionicicum]